MEFFTSRHESFLTRDEFETLEDAYACEIKEDILAAPLGGNEEDTDTLFGDHLRVKFFFLAGEFQKLWSVEIRHMLRQRNNRT
jgi:hypothetical protein